MITKNLYKQVSNNKTFKKLKIHILNFLIAAMFAILFVYESSESAKQFLIVTALYFVTIYYWLPASIYYAHIKQKKIYWIAFGINIFVIILGEFFICRFFPLCFFGNYE